MIEHDLHARNLARHKMAPLATANEDIDGFGSKIFIHFWDDSSGGLLQTIEYHTSCSQTIRLGDVIGNATLVAYVGEKGSGELGPPAELETCTTDGNKGVTYTYRVTSIDGTYSDVEVTDDNGTPGDPNDD